MSTFGQTVPELKPTITQATRRGKWLYNGDVSKRWNRGGRVMRSVANVLSVGLSDLVSTRNAALRRAGFQVVSAASIQETGKACESELFDVVVIGQILSAKEKTLLIHRIKADFHLPVVLMTGGASPHCLADAYVRADAPAEDLFQAIAQLTAQRAAPEYRVG